MLASLCLLVIISRGVGAQADYPEEFCSDPPPVYRGKYFEIKLNQTIYDYGRGIEVTVQPKANSPFRHISDMFLHVPGTDNYPGQHGTNSVGQWYAAPPAAPTYCSWMWWNASGVKNGNAKVPQRKIKAMWVPPQPNDAYYNMSFREAQRPHVYIVVYVTPDPPVNSDRPRHRKRKWYYAVSAKIENREVKEESKRLREERQWFRRFQNFMEAFN